jgi:hypothetical protein
MNTRWGGFLEGGPFDAFWDLLEKLRGWTRSASCWKWPGSPDDAVRRKAYPAEDRSFHWDFQTASLSQMGDPEQIDALPDRERAGIAANRIVLVRLQGPPGCRHGLLMS